MQCKCSGELERNERKLERKKEREREVEEINKRVREAERKKRSGGGVERDRDEVGEKAENISV